jgi:hypothetical protein
MPTGVAATSTLAPVWYVPFVRRTQAPTRKLEYGPVFKEGLSAEIIEGPERGDELENKDWRLKFAMYLKLFSCFARECLFSFPAE